MHGYGIAQHLRVTSDDVLQVGESRCIRRCSGCSSTDGSPASGDSPTTTAARYYSLTAAGRKRLAVERKGFDQMVLAIQRVLEA